MNVSCVGNLRANPFAAQREPPLPSGRVSDNPPFTNSGIDFAGPLYVTNPTSVRKSYIVLFTSQSSRAVHLELVPDLSVESLLLRMYGKEYKTLLEKGTWKNVIKLKNYGQSWLKLKQR